MIFFFLSSFFSFFSFFFFFLFFHSFSIFVLHLLSAAHYWRWRAAFNFLSSAAPTAPTTGCEARVSRRGRLKARSTRATSVSKCAAASNVRSSDHQQ
jgi:hypothetical protein